MIRRRGVALAALALFGCAREPAIPARPALWVVRDADTTLWLLGTVHTLPPNIEWHTPAVRAAIAQADAVAFELPDAPDATLAAFDRVSRGDDLPPLAQRIPAAWRPALLAAMARAGLAPDALDGRKTWGAAAILGSTAARQDGADAAQGVEQVLATEFRAAGKPRLGLETDAEQFGAFDALSEPAQRALLAATIRGVLGHPSYDDTIMAWRRGDVAALAAAAEGEVAGSPELADRLLYTRNVRFAAALAGRMRRPGTVLVAIGAGHLAGSESVVALLQRQGFRVQRVE